MAVRKKRDTQEIAVQALSTTRLEAYILGTTPFIYHAMSSKDKRELILPKVKVTGKARETTAKHDVMTEYRSSFYTSSAAKPKTRLVLPSVMFKASMSSAALDLPDVNKSLVGRLLWVEGDEVEFYGIPEMLIKTVRNSGFPPTPDMRTRPIVREWACKIAVSFVSPMFKRAAVVNLLAAAGIIRGVGDWRTEKGSGNYGSFKLVGENDRAWNKIIKASTVAAQDAAIEEPGYYDNETREMYEWYAAEALRREFKVAK